MNTAPDDAPLPGAPLPDADTPAPRYMRWFTSGIDSLADAGIVAGGCAWVLGDPRSLPYMTAFFPDNRIALDNGACRHFKQSNGQPPALRTVQKFADLEPDRRFAFRLAMDVVGNAALTMRYWTTIFRGRGSFTPVYQWGAPRSHLERYLAEAPCVPAVDANLVAIGGLAPILRGGHRVKDELKKKELENRRKIAVDQLTALCERHPFRFHILGLNHLETIRAIRDKVASADASKWLDGRRYGYLFFMHTRPDGERTLRYAPSGALLTSRSPDTRALAAMETNQRLAHNVQIITRYAEHQF